MGCGFCCVVPASAAARAVDLLSRHHPGTAVIGRATESSGTVELPGLGLVGTEGQGFLAGR